MKKNYLFPVFVFASLFAQATNYYVDGIYGSDLYLGTSSTTPYKTIGKAASQTNAGDTVFVMNGNYSPFSISRPGNITSQIVYTNFPGHLPKIISTNSTYIAIKVNAGTNYITVNGFEVIGWGVNLSLAADTIPAQAAIVCAPGATSTTNVTFIGKYNGSGIDVGGAAVITHHVFISNNIVHDCAAAGIGVGYSDYITIDGNTVYNNSWYTPYGTSGISFGNALNFDAKTTTYRTVVKNNICYGNRLYVLWTGSCTISDGNGIILDITQPSYNGKQLVANNICYNNGGSGIHTLNNNNVDFINNTAYMNSASPTNNGASIYAYGSANPTFFNNIIVARPGKPVNRCPNSTNVVYDYNVYAGGSSIDFMGAHSLNQDPKFVNASTDPTVANFRLQAGSFAINNGDNTNTTAFDRDGNSRPIGAIVDMGAYESNYIGNLNTCSGITVTKILGSGGGTGEPGAIFFGPYDTKPGVSAQKSRRAFIYPQTLIAASGVPTIGVINSLQFKRALQTGSTQTITDNSIIKIYLRNETTDNFGATDFDWNTILSTASNPAVLVYAGDAATLVGNIGGWKNVNFQVPFNYTGSHLGVYVEYLQKGFIASAPDVTWIYDNGGSQPLYNTANYPNQLYGSKSFSAGGSTAVSDLLATNNERRPIITLGYCLSNLPITLLKFTGLIKGNAAYLNWLVATETNNVGFEVQRAKDGINFQPLGFVHSKAVNGNSSAISYYDYIDANPINGTGFYRLLQKDRDGKTTYSLIVSINNLPKQIGLVSIYPNPVGDKLNVIVNIGERNMIATIAIQNLNGKTITQFKKQLLAGYSTIEVDVSKQLASPYILIIELPSGERLIQKFIKQ